MSTAVEGNRTPHNAPVSRAQIPPPLVLVPDAVPLLVLDMDTVSETSPVVALDTELASEPGPGQASMLNRTVHSRTVFLRIMGIVSGRATSVILGHDRSGVSPPGSGAGWGVRDAGG